jgi:hypothetical protein
MGRPRRLERVLAPEQIPAPPPMLKLMKAATMTEKTPATVTDIESASTARWLRRALAPARARVAAGPTEDAVERMRAQIFGEDTPKKRARTLAA